MIDVNQTASFVLFAVDIRSGDIINQVEIAANHSGVVFDASVQGQMSALTLNYGYIYIPFSYQLMNGCPAFTYYRGWIFAYDSQSLELINTFIPSISTPGGSISHSGDSITVDEAGNLYFMTSPVWYSFANKGSERMESDVISSTLL